MMFFLGTHQPQHLADPRCVDVPLFVSRRTLSKRKKLPRSVTTWALDSGGFTELQKYGRWTISAKQYVDEVRHFQNEIGGLLWAAPQDWMCEQIVISGGSASRGLVFAGTDLSVEEHQRRTVDNFLELRALAPDLPFIPVLQGQSVIDYWRCEDLYERAGVDLRAEPVVGVGSVCRRQGTNDATLIMRSFATLKLHAFGVKTLGLRTYGGLIESADSMAWSDTARRADPLPDHDLPGPGRPKGHINCANCLEYALRWRSRLLDEISCHLKIRDNSASNAARSSSPAARAARSR